MLRVFLITIGFLYMTPDLNAQVKEPAIVSQEDTIHPYIPRAEYDGDINVLAKSLEKKYSRKKHRPSGDSVVAFKAFVGKQQLNELQEIELLEGSKSAFSDFILQGLRDSGKVWMPMRQGGRMVKSLIWVQARLNGDGSITLRSDEFNSLFYIKGSL